MRRLSNVQWGVVVALVVGLAAGGFYLLRKSRPSWAALPTQRNPGEPTILGTPVTVGRFAAPPTLDGVLDEPQWRSAVPIGPLGHVNNGESIPKHPIQGFALMGWDDQKLYLAAVVEDRKPSTPFPRDAQDPHIWEQSSAIELMIQPGDPRDNRDYYEIQIDAAGAIFDSRWDAYNKPIQLAADGSKVFGHMDWSSRTERAVTIGHGYYAIEAAIPWAAFDHSRFPVPPKPGDTWRLNLYVFRDGQRVALSWAPLRGEGNFHNAARFGRVKFGG